ncbi:MAG: amidohydrolase family protein [Candidatus Sumerlaeota bacterium]|nr:amidohydrolase family protein [Candidatus Sumerlaeota bacterium]
MMFPGFVDLQVNGRKGVTFSSPELTADNVAAISADLFARGVVGYCPTVITTSGDAYERALPLLARACDDEDGAKILGLHVEGPFLNPADGPRGAHPRAFVRPPSVAFFEKLRQLADDRIAILTLAPEMEGALELIEHVAAKTRIIVSLGHHMADAETIRRAVEAGARACTHVGNGIGGLIDRHRNPLWPMLADDKLSGMFITDGFHLPADLIRVAWRAKGASRFIVTSDRSAVAGMPPGEYPFRDRTVVLEENGFLHLKDLPILAGSSRDMFDCMNHLASLGELTQADLRAAGFDNPLRLLGASIEPQRLARAPKIELAGDRFELRARS